jgi:hypothetical protein
MGLFFSPLVPPLGFASGVFGLFFGVWGVCQRTGHTGAGRWWALGGLLLSAVALGASLFFMPDRLHGVWTWPRYYQ